MFENSNTKSIRRTGLIKRDDRESKNTSCNRKTSASMRSSIVLNVFIVASARRDARAGHFVIRVAHSQVCVVIFLRFRVSVVSLLCSIFCVRMYARGVLLHYVLF